MLNLVITFNEPALSSLPQSYYNDFTDFCAYTLFLPLFVPTPTSPTLLLNQIFLVQNDFCVYSDSIFGSKTIYFILQSSHISIESLW